MNKWYNKLMMAIVAICMNLILTACPAPEDDMIDKNELTKYSWYYNNKDYMIYDYDDPELSIQTENIWLYFLNDGTGIMYIKSTDKDSYFGTSRKKVAYKFQYSLASSKLRLTFKDSLMNRTLTYSNDYLVDDNGSSIYKKMTLDVSALNEAKNLADEMDPQSSIDDNNNNSEQGSGNTGNTSVGTGGNGTTAGIEVDLGLSVKWANKNVGAANPEDYGGYYAWGETTHKSVYDIDSYFDPNYSKYNKSKKTVLDKEDDVASVKWGESWRMPTQEEQNELLTKCTWTWTKQNGINGCLVTSKVNGNSIFLPAAGHRTSGMSYYEGAIGEYWSSSLHQSRNDHAYYMTGSMLTSWGSDSRLHGRSVRPVRSNTSSGTGNSGTGDNTGGGTSTDNAYKATGTHNGHDLVDLGLTVKWATCNIGASNPENKGNYYAWGETKIKSSYDKSNYFDSNYSKYNYNAKKVLDPADDVAHVKWGGNWRMPTKEEQDELRNDCKWTMTSLNGVIGCKVTSNKNGKSIFLPVGGWINGTKLQNDDYCGDYWSCSLGTNNDNAYEMSFSSITDTQWTIEYPTWSIQARYIGDLVRAVCP